MSGDSNHPIKELSARKAAKPGIIITDDYHHFNNLRRYLEDLAIPYPNCISRTGRKQQLKCQCCSIFEIPTVACAVAAYLMHFGKAPKLYQQLIVTEWIKSSTSSDGSSAHLLYRVPYLPFLDYADMLKHEGITCYAIPVNLLNNHFVCKTTIMNIIGHGLRFWKACTDMLEFGPQPHGLIGNENATKSYITDALDNFFIVTKELSEPVATSVVRNLTDGCANNEIVAH